MSCKYFGCSSLQSVTIPDSVTCIGDREFEGCSSLQSVTIPKSVTIIKGNPFSNCPRVINHSNHFTIFEGNLYTSERRKLISYLSKGENFIIPDSVTSIGDWAFYSCTSLQSVTISDSVTNIGDFAFSSCSSLNSVTIPDSVTSIGRYAFNGCKSLQSVTIPESVTSIGRSVFGGCTSLQSIIISHKTYDKLKFKLEDFSSEIKFTD